jgi:hypothetical protein
MRSGVLLKRGNGLIEVSSLFFSSTSHEVIMGGHRGKRTLTGSIRFLGESAREHPHSWTILLNPKPDRCSHDVRSPLLSCPIVPNDRETKLMIRAFDMEKRQHLFSAGVIQPLQPAQVGFYGMGAVTDLGVDIQAAEKEIERKFASTAGDGEVHELKDMRRAGREKDL